MSLTPRSYGGTLQEQEKMGKGGIKTPVRDTSNSAMGTLGEGPRMEKGGGGRRGGQICWILEPPGINPQRKKKQLRHQGRHIDCAGEALEGTRGGEKDLNKGRKKWEYPHQPRPGGNWDHAQPTQHAFEPAGMQSNAYAHAGAPDGGREARRSRVIDPKRSMRPSRGPASTKKTDNEHEGSLRGHPGAG